MTAQAEAFAREPRRGRPKLLWRTQFWEVIRCCRKAVRSVMTKSSAFKMTPETDRERPMLWIIRGYQVISPLLPPSCRFVQILLGIQV